MEQHEADCGRQESRKDLAGAADHAPVADGNDDIDDIPGCDYRADDGGADDRCLTLTVIGAVVNHAGRCKEYTSDERGTVPVVGRGNGSNWSGKMAVMESRETLVMGQEGASKGIRGRDVVSIKCSCFGDDGDGDV